MIKTLKEKNYEFRHPFGVIVADEVEISVSSNGRRSLAAKEIERLSRLAALAFLEKNYRKALEKNSFTLSPQVVRAIMVYLKTNQSEFGQLIGCQKAKVSKILNDEQVISRAQALLALERLALEVARPGAIQNLLGHSDAEVAEADEALAKELNKIRFSAA